MFYTFTADNASTTIGYIGGIIGDFWPLLLIIISVSVAMLIVSKVFKL